MSKGLKNLIIISIDDLRVDAIGANPEKSLKGLNTPTLNRLLKSGTFFNNCITTAPYTTNAHASILTGMWPYNHGIIDFFRNKLEAPTIFEILKNQGFKTLWQTDFPFLLGPILGFTKGIDKFVAKDEEESFVWLKGNKNQRLACFLHFANVHEPFGFVGDKNDRKNFEIKTEELLKKYNIKPDQEALRGKHFVVDNVGEQDLILRQNYKKALQKMYSQKKYREIMNLYTEGVNYFDNNRFEKFIKKLESLGLLKNSILVIIGDHGEVWDKNNQGHYKGDEEDSLTEEIIKVPLIFCGSGIKKDIINRNLARTIDIVPTCLKLLNVNFNDKLDGIDLFSNHKNLIAYSQHWLADSGQITIFMNQAKEKNDLPQPKFRSRLIASAVFQGNDAYKITGGKESGKKKMKKILEDYNNQTLAKIFRKSITKEEENEKIAEQLRVIGYNI